MARMLQYTTKVARLIGALNNVLIVAILSALVPVPDDLTRNFVGPFQVLGEFRREFTQITGQLR